MQEKSSCQHDNFNVSVNVVKTEDTPGLFMVEVTVECADCSKGLVFLGTDIGLSFALPMVSPNGKEIRLPARLENKAPLFIERAGMAGMMEEN